MCDIANEVRDIVRRLGPALPHSLSSPLSRAGWEYALLVRATATPIDRAITYLKDTGSPEHARGRLLLRAAERSLRESGDVGGEET